MTKKDLPKLPPSPGIYRFRSKAGKILYIGKAASLRTRVGSYFLKNVDDKASVLRDEAKKLDIIETDSVLEALILEALLIKKFQPRYNVKEKDDKSFLEIVITKEEWPRVLLVRSKDKEPKGVRFGPFPRSGEAKEALKILRKIFPFRDRCKPESGKPCFNNQIKLCPGVCSGEVSKEDYKKNINHLKLFLRGNKKRLIKELEKEMEKASKEEKFEKAIEFRNRLFSLRHVEDIALLGQSVSEGSNWGRIETYDISNISGKYGVGSMVVFEHGQIAKDHYRKFKIRTIQQANDIGMLKEVFKRRLNHKEWPLPDLVLVDGGVGQVNAAKEFFKDIPVVGIAKGPSRRNDRLFKGDPKIKLSLKLAKQMRDEAHRFAILYHRKLRERL
jgi:excinuclease ABC subunit C